MYVSLDLRKSGFHTELLYKYLEIPILDNNYIYLGKENRCLHAIHHDGIAIHSLSIHQLLNR